MSRNNLYVVIAVLAAAIVGLGIYIFQKESEPSGVDIRIGQDGVSIEQR